MLTRNGVQVVYAAPHNPTAQGSIEVAQRHVKTLITASVSGDKSERGYQQRLKAAVEFYNHSPTIRGFSPVSLLSASVPQNVIDLVNRRLGVRSITSRHNDSYFPDLKVGSKVFIAYPYSTQALRVKYLKMIKNHSYKASHFPTWGSEVHIVTLVDKRRDSYRVDDVDYIYKRGQLQLVPDNMVAN